MNYVDELNGLQINPNKNLALYNNKLLLIELLNLSQSGHSSSDSANPQSKDINLVLSSNTKNFNLDSKDEDNSMIFPVENINKVPSSNFKFIYIKKLIKQFIFNFLDN